MHRLLSRRKAAGYLGVSPFTLDRWKRQRIISFITVGRRVFFDVKDLENFIEMNMVQARGMRSYEVPLQCPDCQGKNGKCPTITLTPPLTPQW